MPNLDDLDPMGMTAEECTAWANSHREEILENDRKLKELERKQNTSNEPSDYFPVIMIMLTLASWVFFLGIGYFLTKNSMQVVAIEHGAAHYNATNGVFEWNKK